MKAKDYISDLFIKKRWYLLMTGIIILFFVAFFFSILLLPAMILLAALLSFSTLDYLLLFLVKGKITVSREMHHRFSLGDDNKINLLISNSFPYKADLSIIDELPEQFQNRTFNLHADIEANETQSVLYNLRPLTRGAFTFGNTLCYLESPLGLLQRRFSSSEPDVVKVYPSYQQLKKYELLALDTTMTGLKRVRRLGHSLEFEKIKEYVPGDDIRTINWKATARNGNIMVNTYTDARQQQIYCLIDKGRNMKMPFDGMTLLDHSINAALALLNVALLKQDKAGLITFSDKAGDIVVAERQSNQLSRLSDALYKQQTDFKESDYEGLWIRLHRSISQRSLFLLFTNFETLSSLDRQLPYLKKMAARHLVCVIFFENTLLRQIHDEQPDSIEGIYIKTVAEQFDYEKKQIVKELRRHGILSVLTTPQSLTVDVINKYLELKARQMT